MANTAPKVKLENVTLMWASLDEKNTMSGKYQVDITNLSPDDCEKVASLGLKARTRDDKPEKGAFIVCRSTYPITALDKSGAPVKAIVGNGTKAEVILSYYVPKRRAPGAPDRSPSLLKLVVTDLVTYAPTASQDDDL